METSRWGFKKKRRAEFLADKQEVVMTLAKLKALSAKATKGKWENG